MNTGDSNIILPYIPHTFACRDPSQESYIVAVTWTHPGPMFRCPSTGCSVEDLDARCGDQRSHPSTQLRTLLHRQLSAEIMDPSDLLARLPVSFLDDAKAVLAGSEIEPHRVKALIPIFAKALCVSASALSLPPIVLSDDAVVQKYEDSPKRTWGSIKEESYEVTELARSVHVPEVRTFLLDPPTRPGPMLKVHMHCYMYNFTQHPVKFQWSHPDDQPDQAPRVLELAPKDSLYIQPFISHSIWQTEPSNEGKVFVVRVSGELNAEALNEYGSWPTSSRHRCLKEKMPWYQMPDAKTS